MPQPEGVAFSKYHDKDTDRDFSFENAYPNYNNIEPSLESKNDNNNNNNNANTGRDYACIMDMIQVIFANHECV